MPKVLNKKHDFIPKTAVYIGRPTKWGNPFSHLSYGTAAVKNCKNAEEAVSRYYEWLKTQPNLLAALKELKGKDLVCWCKPGPCHGDILIKLANEPPTSK